MRLTFDTQSKFGGLWNAVPVDYPDWEMQVNFQVHGTGKEFFGDGFAIWYVRDPKLTGEIFRNEETKLHRASSTTSGPVFGYSDYFYGLAIFVDTYANRQQPEYVTRLSSVVRLRPVLSFSFSLFIHTSP